MNTDFAYLVGHKVAKAATIVDVRRMLEAAEVALYRAEDEGDREVAETLRSEVVTLACEYSRRLEVMP